MYSCKRKRSLLNSLKDEPQSPDLLYYRTLEIIEILDYLKGSCSRFPVVEVVLDITLTLSPFEVKGDSVPTYGRCNGTREGLCPSGNYRLYNRSFYSPTYTKVESFELFLRNR